jgi:hypothetical protein
MLGITKFKLNDLSDFVDCMIDYGVEHDFCEELRKMPNKGKAGALLRKHLKVA